MADVFKTHFTNYDEATLNTASELNIKVSDMIIRELLPDIDYDSWTSEIIIILYYILLLFFKKI